MAKTSSAVDETIIDGDVWLRELVKGHVFRKAVHTVSLCRCQVLSELHVRLPGSTQVDVIPRSSEVIFYQPYPATNRANEVAAILFPGGQIVINGDGRIFRKHY